MKRGLALLGACAWLLQACTMPSPPPQQAPVDSPTKGWPGTTAPDVRDSAWMPLDRATPAPAGYGLYSVLLTRSANRNTLRVLGELFSTTDSAGETAFARENLNLVAIPVKNTSDAARLLVAARQQPQAAAAALMQQSYDHGQATMILASVCHPSRGAQVMKVCGSQSPEGPLLVTAARPIDGKLAAGQPLLVVNLSSTPPEAVREVLAAYRRQILRADFADRAEVDGWRLRALNHVLDAAKLLPELSKAYASAK